MLCFFFSFTLNDFTSNEIKSFKKKKSQKKYKRINLMIKQSFYTR